MQAVFNVWIIDAIYETGTFKASEKSLFCNYRAALNFRAKKKQLDNFGFARQKKVPALEKIRGS